MTCPPSSDRRLKKDIVDYTDGLEWLEKAQPRRFKWIDDDRPDIGFIAQEMKKIAPGIVMRGETDDFRKDPMAIDYEKITVRNTAALKEVLALVRAQAKRITALEAELEVLP